MSVVTLENNKHIAIITINRPDQYNALNQTVLEELSGIVNEVAEDNSIRAVILTGQGEKAFIAGADIKEMAEMNTKEAIQFSKLGQDLTVKIETLHIPVIAAVNGFALGGGCEFALACQIRYASENALFGQPEVGLGLIAGFGGTQRLPRIVGKGLALEILLSGNSISADDAAGIGLVNKVFPQETLMPSVLKIAEKITSNAPTAISKTIASVNKGLEVTLNEGLSIEQEEFSSLFDTQDTKEGLSAFIEKRKPNFTGD
ncbi:MAG: enoyl-CoA hydratase-related protein [Candidatus Marinimicrobia bacterium]|jgi:enoyl-CoA hydratase|nr:enoyl-CoA hydratase-related protein [Candidatus Neomarinimicrobiota bacterium]